MIGQRHTKTRKIIFKVFDYFDKPISAYDIFNFLKKQKKSVDLASVYRTLNLMEKSNAISTVLYGDNKKRYELISNHKHHHHLICENCGDVEDIKMKEEELLGKVKNKTKFLIKNHKLEFFGLCPKCKHTC